MYSVCSGVYMTGSSWNDVQHVLIIQVCRGQEIVWYDHSNKSAIATSNRNAFPEPVLVSSINICWLLTFTFRTLRLAYRVYYCHGLYNVSLLLV